MGRPGVMKLDRELVVRFPTENSTWGYCRIEGALRNLGHKVAPSTIAKILKEHGTRPAPDRPSSFPSEEEVRRPMENEFALRRMAEEKRKSSA